MPATQAHAAARPSKAPLFAAVGAVAVAAIIGGVALLWPKPETVGTTVTTQPAPPPPAADGRELAYYLTVQKYKDGQPYKEPRRLAKEMLFGADDRLRLTVAGTQPGYLYIVNEGPSPAGGFTYNVLHPKTTVDDGSAKLAPGGEVHIPSAQSYFAFDEAQGTENLWLIFAREQVPALEAVKGAANAVDRGAVKDPAQLQGLRAFLDQHRGQAARSTPDEGTGRTVLHSSSPVLVSLLKLEHM